MATIQQIDANRRNARKSTGPSTPEGKQHSSMNAFRSGVYAESEIIPGEDPAQLDRLKAEYHDHHRPATPEIRALVDSLIRAEWLLRRLHSAEAALFVCDCPNCKRNFDEKSVAAIISGHYSCDLKKLDLLQRRINAAERNFHRSLKALQSLESLQPPSLPAGQPAERIDPEATSEKLASFQQIACQATEASESAQPASVTVTEPAQTPDKSAQSGPREASLASLAAPAPGSGSGQPALHLPDPFLTTSLSPRSHADKGLKQSCWI